jgi:aspartate aminotransferase/aminotransferase
MKPLSSRALGMPASGIREIMDLAWQIPDCIHLEVGQPDFPSPLHVKDAGIAAIQENFTQYTSARGIPGLQQAILEKLTRRNRIQATTENITVCPGAVTALDTAILAIVESGDEVLVPDPGWPNPVLMIDFLGAKPVAYPLHPRHEFLPDPLEMETLISPRTKAVIVNSPSNPTGAVLPPLLVQKIYQLAVKHDLYLISDEIYEDLVFEGEATGFGSYYESGRVICVFGVSKSYAMTGWRLGYVYAPTAISAVITKMQEPLVSCASSISQKAAEAALRGPQDVVRQMREAYCRRRDLALSILRRYGLYEYTPGGAFYVMVNVGRLGSDSRKIAKMLVREVKVATAPGTAFGRNMCQYVRISLAASDANIQEGLERICRLMNT